ncbi:MAG: N-acetyltransferase [Spirochaetales bacterium]|nr:MAG: N-acetyltransferase [Spirochaetales bacterium]
MNDNLPALVRRATVDDVNDIFRLTNDMAAKGLMLPRSKYRIITSLNNFMVAEISGNTGSVIAGCGAFVLLWTDMGEIMSLAVAEEYRNRGLGSLLVQALIDEGRRLKVPEIITLTYQVDFFKAHGFAAEDKDKFPRKLWRECLECPKLEQCDETAMHLMV